MPRPARDQVLVSWIARNNDPFDRKRGSREYILRDGVRVQGPTLNLLFDQDSAHRGQVGDVVLFHQTDSLSAWVYDELRVAIRERDAGVRVHEVLWKGRPNPTDHRAIFAHVRAAMQALRARFEGRELIINVSPGTPAMHTIWVLMGETGFIADPVRLVQSVAPFNRDPGDPVTVPVDVGVDTFYKRWQAATPREVASQEEAVTWDPTRFRSAALKALYARARRFAQLKVPVLILGERGTGKTTLAGWIRMNSPYRKDDLDRGWPAVACGQYDPGTMRSELFGHTEGAFTGAARAREGLLARADGDTLFLDEIGDVSREVQRLLIKALEEKNFRPLGADEDTDSDFRLISATNRDREALAARLDADFLDRVATLTLRVPPLREVPEDLDWIWEVVYRQAVHRAAIAPERARLSTTAHARIVAHLGEHPLPGNLRDLFQVAYLVIAALADPVEPAAEDEAVAAALEELDAAPRGAVRGPTRDIAASFAEGRPLGAGPEIPWPLPTKRVTDDLKRYLAQEIRREANRRDQPPETLCDVSRRTLNNWLAQETS